jgi:hypothetical protein
MGRRAQKTDPDRNHEIKVAAYLVYNHGFELKTAAHLNQLTENDHGKILEEVRQIRIKKETPSA